MWNQLKKYHDNGRMNKYNKKFYLFQSSWFQDPLVNISWNGGMLSTASPIEKSRMITYIVRTLKLDLHYTLFPQITRKNVNKEEEV